MSIRKRRFVERRRKKPFKRVILRYGAIQEHIQVEREREKKRVGEKTDLYSSIFQQLNFVLHHICGLIRRYFQEVKPSSINVHCLWFSTSLQNIEIKTVVAQQLK